MRGVTTLPLPRFRRGAWIYRPHPKSPTTEVPDKAIIHERCALIVRTGSIGTAVKVDVRDRGAVISSHLIRLEFEDEAAAAAVAAYFCSPAGKILQHKISYGAVQPQIGQDELLALPIPQFVLDAKEQILALVTEQERVIRASKSLTTAAKYLVESLIEGQLTEAELLTAEKALQAGNDRLDRVILSRLNTDGIDGQGPVLFGDLGELYQLLSLAEGIDDQPHATLVALIPRLRALLTMGFMPDIANECDGSALLRNLAHPVEADGADDQGNGKGLRIIWALVQVGLSASAYWPCAWTWRLTLSCFVPSWRSSPRCALHGWRLPLRAVKRQGKWLCNRLP
ncbi:hypothetical protein BANRA_05765 [Pseudomonas aeruginosa]|nr:hypothetical protein BANRA_05765 [Pseudomonas aeruginosa]